MLTDFDTSPQGAIALLIQLPPRNHRCRTNEQGNLIWT